MGNQSSAPASEFGRLYSAIHALRSGKSRSLDDSSIDVVREFVAGGEKVAVEVNQSFALLRFNVDKVEMDTRFLHILFLSLDYWSNDKIRGNKIRFLVDRAAQDFPCDDSRANLPEMLGAVRHSQSLMCDLVSEFGESIEDFRVLESWQPPEMGSFLQLWSEFVKSTLQCLMDLKMRFCVNDANVVFAPQIDSLHTILSLCLDFVLSIGEPLLLNQPDFMAHAISVVTCVANRSCCCWFLATDPVAAKGKITAILHLQHKIDLARYAFYLRCLYAMRATNESELSGYLFLRYLFKYPDTTDGLFEELVPLARLAVRNEAGFPGKSLLGEIEELLFWVGVLFQPDAFMCSELYVRTCLLKVEVQLQQLLQDNSRLPGPELNALVDELKIIATTLGGEEQAMEFVVGVARDIQTSLGSEDTTMLSWLRNHHVICMKIVVFKSKYFLRGSPDLSTLKKEDRLIRKFKQRLELFTAIVTNLQLDRSEIVKMILLDAEEICRSIISFSYSYFACKNREELVSIMQNLFPDYLCIMNSIFSGFSGMGQLNVSNINVLRYADLLLENLQDLPIHDPHTLSTVKHFVEEIQVTLQSWRPFLTAYVDSVAAENPKLSNLYKQATLVVYKVACVIDMIEIDGVWQHVWCLNNLIQEMRIIDNQVPANVQMRQSSYKGHHVTRLFPRINKTKEEMVVASRGVQEGDIINELKRGSRQQYIISIVGMPGIGKTTLAKKVFNDPKVKLHFNRFTWCSVSQMRGKKDLLLEILKDTDALGGDSADLELKLYRLLKQHRYLIVLDDLWDVEAFNGLANVFQENENGSKILITTRDHNVASDARPKGGDPYILQPLPEEESWDLLEMKLFHVEGPVGSCPDELVEVGKEIARACKGLPLSIVAVAGILERTEKRVEFWTKIAENLSSQIIDDPQTQCKDILEFCYMCLPLHLRECFLYLGAIVEYRNVSASKLIRLWIAEGFIEKNGSDRSLEDIAEDYLMDLTDRSLVMISEKRCNGMVKSCSIHDLLRDFCLKKAKTGNLFQLITNQDEPYASFDGVDYGHELYEHCKSNPVLYEGHRVCVHLKRKHFVDSRASGPWTRSLMLLPSVDVNPTCHYDISFIPQRFRLLTVLDLEYINVSNGFPPDIENLVQLRYLAVSGHIKFIPESIEKLWRLETFIVKGSSDEIVLPSTIWHLVKLRHLHVKLYATFTLKDNFTEVGSLMLHDLVTLSSPELSSGMENIIMRLPCLRKLSCMFCKSTQFPELRSLTCLESLRIIYSGTALTSADFCLPDGLKKLTLSTFALPWNQIYAIAKLPNLEVLKLVCRAYEGTLWDMGDIEFPVLKFLMLDSLNIVQWVGSSDNLPLLEKLVVKNCKELEEVPSDFAGIGTLVTIEVQRCKQSVAQSVIKIKEVCEDVCVIIG